MLFVTRGSYGLYWYGSVVDMGRLKVYLIVMENLLETHRHIQYLVVNYIK